MLLESSVAVRLVRRLPDTLRFALHTMAAALIPWPKGRPAVAQAGAGAPGGAVTEEDARETPAFKTPAALEARAACARATNKARDEYRQHVLKAKRAYRDALVEAKKAVMKAGDLDEANALQAELKMAEKDMAAIPTLPPPHPGPDLVIRHATYGAGERQEDVTRALNLQVRDGRIDEVPGLADPAPGVLKTMVIEGAYGGANFVLNITESFPVQHLKFGRPKDASATSTHK
jgi:hypothetical protein